jgi:hypothetical protein
MKKLVTTLSLLGLLGIAAWAANIGPKLCWTTFNNGARDYTVIYHTDGVTFRNQKVSAFIPLKELYDLAVKREPFLAGPGN